MTDTLTPGERSKRMSLVRCKNTKPEMVVRKLAHGMGLRYRLHWRGLPGRPDLVFPSRRKVIFVHGCFWHRHPDAGCALARLPKSRLDFWLPKLEKNRERDELAQARLRQLGWDFLVIWECELGNRENVKLKIKDFIGKEENEIR